MATDNQITVMTAAIVAVAKSHHLTAVAPASAVQSLAEEAAKAAAAAYEANAPESPK